MKSVLVILLFLHNPFPWAADRKLQWSDFEGEITNNFAAASSCTGLIMWEEKDSTGGVIFKVEARFDPSQSFVSPSCSKSDYALHHEQLHFDITELYARQLRMALAPLQHTHKQADVQVAGNFYDVVKEAWGLSEERYDMETDNANNVDAQYRWKKKIAHQLDKLERYANKPSAVVCSFHRRGG